jgi:hypothetical protein
VHIQLLAAPQEDERAGYPSASEYGRLLKCRASHLLTKKAKALGQVAHERSEAADLGTKKHLANTEGPEILSDGEREDWEISTRKREEFLRIWLEDSATPFSSVKEERLWLRKGLRPLLTGKPDEILRQGDRCLILDHKFGSYRVDDPRDNVQSSPFTHCSQAAKMRRFRRLPVRFFRLIGTLNLSPIAARNSTDSINRSWWWWRAWPIPATQCQAIIVTFVPPG